MDLSFYTNFSANIAQQESQISVLQQEISSGVAVQTPDQNPAAYETATIAQDQVGALTSEQTTQATIQTQLGAVSSAYSSVSSLYDNVQSVLEQALNGTTSTANLRSLASQITAASQQLVAIGNTTGANDSYLFGGTRNSVAPFQAGAGGAIIYFGDGGQSQAAISPDGTAATGANGDVFVSGLSGDGTASVAAAAGNTGTGVLLSQGVENPTAAATFQSGNKAITLSFANGANGLTYKATEGGATVASGTVTADLTLQLGGVGYQLTGSPAAGDKFTLSPSRPQTAFALLQSIATTLSTTGTTPQQVAQTSQQLNQDLASLAQYQNTVVAAQAQNGVTLQAVNNAATNDSNQSTTLQATVNNEVGVNTAVAITTLDETSTALQAALKAFGDIQDLSLFNYIS